MYNNLVLQQIHNKSNKWSLSFTPARRLILVSEAMRAACQQKSVSPTRWRSSHHVHGPDGFASIVPNYHDTTPLTHLDSPILHAVDNYSTHAHSHRETRFSRRRLETLFVSSMKLHVSCSSSRDSLFHSASISAATE
jgi:hypothetical protein